MPNPKGHLKSIEKHKIKPVNSKSMTAQISLRMTPELLEKLKARDNWQDFARKTLEKAVELESA